MTVEHRFRALFLVAAAAAGLSAPVATPAARAEITEEAIAEQQLLGDRDADRRWADLLPFTRQFTVRGRIDPDLRTAAVAAGVPASALVEPLRALSARLGPAELAAGDRFRVSWEQTLGQDGAAIGSARVTSLDVSTAKTGVVAISRFRAFAGPAAGHEVFYFADGTLAAPPPIRLPLDEIRITSGYGLRADPLDQPARMQPVVAPPAASAAPAATEPPPRSAADRREVARAYAGFGNGEQLGNSRSFGGGGLQTSELDRIMVERRLRRLEEEARKKAEAEAEAQRQDAAEKEAARRAAAPPPAPAKPTVLYMHEGLDLLAPHGTPVRAASDGFVVLARPDRGYGNAIHVEHERGYLTLYAHLARFAAGIEPGVWVNRGDVIGFVGSTGRSTGAHLHFELLVRGRPVDPSGGTAPIRLGAADLARLKRQFAFEHGLRREPTKNDSAPTRDRGQIAKAP